MAKHPVGYLVIRTHNNNGFEIPRNRRQPELVSYALGQIYLERKYNKYGDITDKTIEIKPLYLE